MGSTVQSKDRRKERKKNIPLIPQQRNLLLTLPLNPMIPLPLLPLLILIDQQKPRNHTATKQKHKQIPQHNPMPDIVPRRIEVDIRANDTIDIAIPNHRTHNNPPLKHPLHIVRAPHNRIRNRRVDPQRPQVHTRVLHARVGRPDQHAEPDDADQGDSDIVQTALLVPVGAPTDEHGRDGRDRVGRHAEQVRRGVLVPQVLDHAGGEEGEGVQRAVAPAVHHAEGVCLPVRVRLLYVALCEFLVGGRGLPVGFEAFGYACFFRGGQEPRLVGEVVDQPVGGYADEDGG